MTPGKVARERERERHRWVQVSAGDVSEGVDHHHDHEPEGDRDTDVAKRAHLRIDHDRAAACEDERERADRLGDENPRQRHHAQSALGRSCPISTCTFSSSSSRMLRTVSRSWPAGSSRVPVLVALPRVDRACVPAAHRDHGIRCADDLVGEWLRELLAHVDAELLHRLDHSGVDALARVAAGGADVDATLRAELHESCGHLAAPCVVHADEENFGRLLREEAFGLSERFQALACETVREHGDVDVDLRIS